MSEKLLEQILNEMKEMKDEMKDEMKEMKQDISKIKETMVVKEDIADIPAMKVAIFEILDSVKRVETIQEKHERTLDLLSRRSIDQEAELKRIK